MAESKTCKTCGKSLGIMEPGREIDGEWYCFKDANAAQNAQRTANTLTPKDPVFDKSDQFARIKAYVLPGESIYAVYDCKGAGTGFVGITDQRLIFFDQGVFTKHKTMISIPYNQVIGVACADDGMIFKTSEITVITAAGRFSFEFRGSDKAQSSYIFIMNQILNQVNPQKVN